MGAFWLGLGPVQQRVAFARPKISAVVPSQAWFSACAGGGSTFSSLWALIVHSSSFRGLSGPCCPCFVGPYVPECFYSDLARLVVQVWQDRFRVVHGVRSEPVCEIGYPCAHALQWRVQDVVLSENACAALKSQIWHTLLIAELLCWCRPTRLLLLPAQNGSSY